MCSYSVVMFAFTVIIILTMENEKVSLGAMHVIILPAEACRHSTKIKLDIVIISLIPSKNALLF